MTDDIMANDIQIFDFAHRQKGGRISSDEIYLTYCNTKGKKAYRLYVNMVISNACAAAGCDRLRLSYNPADGSTKMIFCGDKGLPVRFAANKSAVINHRELVETIARLKSIDIGGDKGDYVLKVSGNQAPSPKFLTYEILDVEARNV